MYTGNTRVSVFSNDCIICSDSSSSSGAGNSYSNTSSRTGAGSGASIYCKYMEL